MAESNEFFICEVEKFNKCRANLARLVFKDTEEFRNSIHEILEELHSIEYGLKVAPDEVRLEHTFNTCFCLFIHWKNKNGKTQLVFTGRI